jgi:hypothetical protein
MDKDNKTEATQISRRDLLKTGIGAIGAGLVLPDTKMNP